MRQDIEERIDQIRRGQLPSGYQMNKDIGLAPSDWTVGKISDVLHNVQRPVEKPSDPYWRLGLRSHAKGTFHELVKNPDEIDMDELYKVRKNDLVVNITFAWEHAIALAGVDDDGLLVSHRFPTYVFDNDNSPQYFKAMVTQRFFKEMLGNISPGGAGRNRVMSKSAFLKLPCYIPAVKEQKRIVTVLTNCDKVVSLKMQLIEEKRRQKKWLVQKLLDPNSGVRLPGFENSEWCSKILSEMCSYISDGDWVESKDQSSKGIRLIQTGNIGVGTFLAKSAHAKYVSDDTFVRLNCSEVFLGDILLSRLPDPIGRACMIPKMNSRAITAVDCTIARFYKYSEAMLFLQYSCCDDYFQRVSSLSGGSTRTRISRKELEKLNVFLPKDVNEQTAIVKILSTADREIDLLEQDLSMWQNKKKALIQLLLTGIVRV